MQLAKPDPILLLVILLVLSPALHVAAGSYEFVLTKGMGVPVCDAYLKRLNRIDFSAPPYCDRPENSDVPGFAALNRVFLNANEIFKLDRQVYGFRSRKDIHDWEKELARRKRLGLPIPTDAGRRAEIELQLRLNVVLQNHFRFEPPVDIDNDGAPDQVVVWRETGYICGGSLGNNPGPVRASTFVLVLDSQGNVDPMRTQEIFGHPTGGYVVQFKNTNGEMVTKEAERFRPVGTYLGILSFRGKTYFDTFYDEWGDLDNQRRNDSQIYNTLALFKRERGKTEAVCELLWKEPKSGSPSREQ